MSLDQNLFTLLLKPLAEDPLVVTLVDPKGAHHYRKHRVPGPIYKAEIYDPSSESLLATATSVNAKHKTIELYNPTSLVEMRFTGLLNFRWTFFWEDQEYEWKREECYMVRKPDPSVIVAVTREPSGKIKTQSVQLLDYNLNRFDIEDRKGLEIVILTALLTFQDANEVIDDGSLTPNLGSKPPLRPSSSSEIVPVPPPKPAPRTGVQRIAEMQALRNEINEITVAEECEVMDYASYCSSLLLDDAMLFITITSDTTAQVGKVLQVVEQTKRLRHKSGKADDEDLHQYVRYESAVPTAVRRAGKVIKLDDEPENIPKADSKYAPPDKLTVHLSKIAMPELQPRPTRYPSSSAEKATLKSRREPSEGASSIHKAGKAKSSGAKNKLTKPTSPSSNQPYRLQPSPSPSQLNNPIVYAAPPPVVPPRNAYSHPPARPGPPPIPPVSSSQSPSSAPLADHRNPATIVTTLLDRFKWSS